jgi:hypothetical protein
VGRGVGVGVGVGRGVGVGVGVGVTQSTQNTLCFGFPLLAVCQLTR